MTTNSATKLIFNTHCVVCGGQFQRKRVNKLYCSGRCKQYGHNHRDEIAMMLGDSQQGISASPLLFSIGEYTIFNRNQKLLKRYKELEYKRHQWESENQEIVYREKFDLSVSTYLFDSYIKKKLTESDEDEIFAAETELDESVLCINSRELSIEQWFFIKSLYPNLDTLSLFEIICSLSKDFIVQLNLTTDLKNKAPYSKRTAKRR